MLNRHVAAQSTEVCACDDTIHYVIYSSQGCQHKQKAKLSQFALPLHCATHKKAEAVRSGNHDLWAITHTTA